MATANKKGWDFIKVGNTYQYKEDGFIASVTVLEDNSTDEKYQFKLQINESTDVPPSKDGVFEIEHVKDFDGYYSGMMNLYEREEYRFIPVWKKND